MAVTMSVNSLTVVHAGSTGMAISFPDVCKTPSPAGPVPIPYPNIAKSSDTADGSTTVKVDGNPIMLKSSNFCISTGDEAGSALGVVSNKIKGKAIPVNASFDVKVDGKNVFRLIDPMQTNCGSNPNAFNPAEVQGPLPPGIALSGGCVNLHKKRMAQAGTDQSKNAGMLSNHFQVFKDVAKRNDCVFYVRKTDAVCQPFIEARHQPKPHAVFFGNTIKPVIDKETKQEIRLAAVDNWLKKTEESVRAGKFVTTGKSFGDKEMGERRILFIEDANRANLIAGNEFYSMKADDYAGIVGRNHSDTIVEPLKRKIGVANRMDYAGKWITADYDIFHIIRSHFGCEQIKEGEAWSKIKDEINRGCQWDAIQHGPQTQWISNDKETAAIGQKVDFPSQFYKAMKSRNEKQKVEFRDEQGKEKRKPMKVIDDNVTVISPAGEVFLETQRDTLDALLCRECEK